MFFDSGFPATPQKIRFLENRFGKEPSESPFSPDFLCEISFLTHFGEDFWNPPEEE